MKNDKIAERREGMGGEREGREGRKGKSSVEGEKK